MPYNTRSRNSTRSSSRPRRLARKQVTLSDVSVSQSSSSDSEVEEIQFSTTNDFSSSDETASFPQAPAKKAKSPDDLDSDLFDNSQNPKSQLYSSCLSDEEPVVISSDIDSASAFEEEPAKPRRSRRKSSQKRVESRASTRKIVLRDRDSLAKAKKPLTVATTGRRPRLRTTLSSVWPRKELVNGNDSSDSSSDSDADNKRTPVDVIKPIKFDSDEFDWSMVGGLTDTIRSLKEAIILPSLYPDVFNHFDVTPPKGILLVGPPGTGKTLLARVLASVSGLNFFIRKGSDIMSKYVGEAERQLRLMFEAAKKHSPSVIFFDEIDGLTPPRNSRSDNHYSSVVSTLLALIDGVEDRGNVFVLAATNRPDNIDPALRRPGRFDREVLFELPNEHGRLDILNIYTRKWKNPPDSELLSVLVRKTKEFSGADLRALCAESVMNCIRRTFPEAYLSLTSSKVHGFERNFEVNEADFMLALNRVGPSVLRSTRKRIPTINASNSEFCSLFKDRFTESVEKLAGKFYASVPMIDPLASEVVLSSQSQEWFGLVPVPKKESPGISKFLLHGNGDFGQSVLSAMILDQLNIVQFYDISAPELFSDQHFCAEHGLHSILNQVSGSQSDSVLFLGNIPQWFEELSSTCASMLTNFMSNSFFLQNNVFFISTSFVHLDALYPSVQGLFESNSLCFELKPFLPDCISLFYHDYIKSRVLSFQEYEQLPVSFTEVTETIPQSSTAELSAINTQIVDLKQSQEKYLRKLRMEFREVVRFLTSRFTCFVEDSFVPDYSEIETVPRPICLLDIVTRVDDSVYPTAVHFRNDLLLLRDNLLRVLAPKYCLLSFAEKKLIQSRMSDLFDTFEERLEFIPKKLSVKSLEIHSQIEKFQAQKCSILASLEVSMMSSNDRDCLFSSVKRFDSCNLPTPIPKICLLTKESVTKELLSLVPVLTRCVFEQNFSKIIEYQQKVDHLLVQLSKTSTESAVVSKIDSFRKSLNVPRITSEKP
ncbi:hypothetical protein GEMRC1_003469 [Eukaryota sp. GEM-RC1]